MFNFIQTSKLVLRQWQIVKPVLKWIILTTLTQITIQIIPTWLSSIKTNQIYNLHTIMEDPSTLLHPMINLWSLRKWRTLLVPLKVPGIKATINMEAPLTWAVLSIHNIQLTFKEWTQTNSRIRVKWTLQVTRVSTWVRVMTRMGTRRLSDMISRKNLIGIFTRNIRPIHKDHLTYSWNLFSLKLRTLLRVQHLINYAWALVIKSLLKVNVVVQIWMTTMKTSTWKTSQMK